MKSRCVLTLAACALLAALAPRSGAQTLTRDTVFLKAGYLPAYTYIFDVPDADPQEYHGFALQGEYNLNFDPVWIGIGVEWERLYWDEDVDFRYDFIAPSATIKLVALGGLYLGAGVAGRYLINAEGPSPFFEPESYIDLWVNGVAGYFFPVAEAVFVDLGGRAGYNLTRRQFADAYDVENNYDIAFYLGVGFRAAASDY